MIKFGEGWVITPVLTLEEAPDHPHMIARNTFERGGQHARPGAAPRFRESSADNNTSERQAATDSDAILRQCGFGGEEILSLRQARIIA